MSFEVGDYVSTVYRPDIVWQVLDIYKPSKCFLLSSNGRRTLGHRLNLICIGTTPGRNSIYIRGNKVQMSESEVFSANPMLVIAMEAAR